jgi:hypothetical protein
MPPNRLKACAHTCPHNGNASNKVSRRQTALRTCYIFHIVGSTLSRHERSRQMHPSCTNSCPAHETLCQPCHCPPLDNPPKCTKGREPTHQEWIQWGELLYKNLKPEFQKFDWPLYYTDIVTGGLPPIPPSPGISIWNTAPPKSDDTVQSPPSAQNVQSPAPPIFPQPFLSSPLLPFSPTDIVTHAPQTSPELPQLFVPSPHLPPTPSTSRCQSTPQFPTPHRGLRNVEPDVDHPLSHPSNLSAIFVEEVSNCAGWGQLKMSSHVANRIRQTCPNNIKCSGDGDSYLVNEYVSLLILDPIIF